MMPLDPNTAAHAINARPPIIRPDCDHPTLDTKGAYGAPPRWHPGVRLAGGCNWQRLAALMRRLVRPKTRRSGGGIPMSLNFLTRLGYVCAAISLGFAGCTPPTPPGATTSAAFNDQVTATVIGIDRAKRGLTLRSSEGQVAEVYVSDAVRNFDRIAVGDTVQLTVHARFEVTATGNSSLPGVIAEEGMARAPAGSRPAGIWAARTQRSVQIVSVDKVGHTVTFREPDGRVDSFTVQNPANYAFADGLQPGSYVTVVETNAVAASVNRL